MTDYPTLTKIEAEWRAAKSGLCLIVEGETDQADPWFYQRWFGAASRRFTFFPQDGWEKVQTAVSALRASLGRRKVYGLIDRDFEPAPSYPPLPPDGVVRTAKYTLENYLLDAECWFNTVHPFTLRQAKPGWNTLAETQTTIAELYRQCLSLSAYNWVLRQARTANPVGFATLPDREYREHPRGLPADTVGTLRAVQTHLGLTDDLGQLYLDRLAWLQDQPFTEWEQLVSGKYVLKLLRETFPLGLSGRQAWDDMLGAYMRECYEPPPDLVTLLEAIWQDAQKGTKKHEGIFVDHFLAKEFDHA